MRDSHLGYKKSHLAHSNPDSIGLQCDDMRLSRSAQVLLALLLLAPAAIKLAVPFEHLAPHYGRGQAFMTGLHETGYLFSLVAVTELAAGVLLLANRYVPLALVIVAPVLVNIVLFHVLLAPTVRGLAVATIVVGLAVRIAYDYPTAWSSLLSGAHQSHHDQLSKKARFAHPTVQPPKPHKANDRGRGRAGHHL